jgi:hypothetical protein
VAELLKQIPTMPRLVAQSLSLFSLSHSLSTSATLSLLLDTKQTGKFSPRFPGINPAYVFGSSVPLPRTIGLSITSKAQRIRMIATASERSAICIPGADGQRLDDVTVEERGRECWGKKFKVTGTYRFVSLRRKRNDLATKDRGS